VRSAPSVKCLSRPGLAGLALSASLLCSAAHAGLVQADYLVNGDNLAVSDTTHGLTWLDLSVSKGWNTGNWSANVQQNAGWRLATNTEVENLLIDVFSNFTNPHLAHSLSASNAAQTADIAGFSSLFGSTWAFRSYGYYQTEDAVFRMAGVDYTGAGGTVWGGEFSAYGAGAAVGDANIGLYIVRSAVPEPGTLALVGLSLAGLMLGRRGRQGR
jgi:hypothetical protein